MMYMVALDLGIGVLAVEYIVYVMVQSDLLTPVRKRIWDVPLAGQFMGKVLSCPHCSAFWAGLLVAILWLVGGWAWRFAMVCALAGGGQLLYLAMLKLDEVRRT